MTMNVKETILEGAVERVEAGVETKDVPAAQVVDVMPGGTVEAETTMLTMEEVKPKGGDFIKAKPVDIQPMLQRIAILNSTFEEFDISINATDTSGITADEVRAFNEIAKAFENAKETLLKQIQ